LRNRTINRIGWVKWGGGLDVPGVLPSQILRMHDLIGRSPPRVPPHRWVSRSRFRSQRGHSLSMTAALES
jgi:hypothetical protein